MSLDSPDNLPKPLELVLRAAFLADASTIPTTPGQVVAHDRANLTPSTATPVPTPSFKFSWENKADNVIPFPSLAGLELLSLAARSHSPISAETRARLSQLLKDATKPDGNGR